MIPVIPDPSKPEPAPQKPEPGSNTPQPQTPSAPGRYLTAAEFEELLRHSTVRILVPPKGK